MSSTFGTFRWATPFCVRRYFWKRLLGLSGMVRSMNPALRAGSIYRSLKFACPFSPSASCSSVRPKDFSTSAANSRRTSPVTSPVTLAGVFPVLPNMAFIRSEAISTSLSRPGMNRSKALWAPSFFITGARSSAAPPLDCWASSSSAFTFHDFDFFFRQAVQFVHQAVDLRIGRRDGVMERGFLGF